MIKTGPCLLVLVLIITGCAHWQNMQRMDEFQEFSSSYEKAMQWSDFEVAAPYHTTATDMSGLQQIKVTTYEVKKMIVNQDQTRITQVVDIGYYPLQTMTEKRMTTKQIWVYNDQTQLWRIESPFPNL